jgi:hypothetical protein
MESSTKRKKIPHPVIVLRSVAFSYRPLQVVEDRWIDEDPTPQGQTKQVLFSTYDDDDISTWAGKASRNLTVHTSGARETPWHVM